jgi:hypothetical protein
MRTLIIIPGMALFFMLAGCLNRQPLFDLATTRPSDLPAVIVFDPADNLIDVPRNALIAVLFSKSMDRNSVEENFSFSYGGKFYDARDGAFLWDNNSRMFVFRPFSILPSYTTVSVVLGFYAQSTDGLNIPDASQWRFITGSTLVTLGPSLNDAYPTSAKGPGVYGFDAQILLEFDNAMLRSSVEGSFLLMSDDFQDIRTVNDGYFQWTYPGGGLERAIFVPDEPLMPDKRYTAYLNANGIWAVDLAGNALNPGGLLPLTFETIDDAIYVSGAVGNNANPGYHRTLAVQDINTAVTKAVSNGFSHVKIAQGTYTEDVVLTGTPYNDFRLEGGWNNDFSFYDSNPTIYPAVLRANVDSYTITLSAISGITLEGLTIRGPNTGPPDINGAVLINGGSSTITITRCDVVGSDDAQEGRGLFITGNCENIDVSNSWVLGTIAAPNAIHGYAIFIDSSRNIAIRSNNSLGGSAGTSSNTAVYLSGSSDSITISENVIIGGTNGKRHGILIGSGVQNVIIRDNPHISAGFSGGGSGPSYGIYVSDSAYALIQDNPIIDGGQVNEDDSYGIYVLSNATANIYRNRIVGGEDIGGLAANTTTAVHFSASNDSRLYNNFIIGAWNTNDSNNQCYGVNINNCDVQIINNTIDAGGGGGPGSTYAISGSITDSTIANNIIVGGNGTGQIGIELSSYLISENDVLIVNNSFDIDKTAQYLTDGVTPYNTIPALESGYNVTPRNPSGNNEYSSLPAPGEVEFINAPSGDYQINTVASVNESLIQNNGRDLRTLTIFSSGVPPDATIDKFGTDRPLTSIDRGAHEFSP